MGARLAWAVLALLALGAAACGGGDGGGVNAECHEFLDATGTTWSAAGETPGIVDPVRVEPSIAGVSYRYIEPDTPRSSILMDCALARALVEAGPILVERGVTEVVDVGVYNYRCIGGGEPPDCPNGLSDHAFGTAIDMAGFSLAGGAYYTVVDDWVIDPDGDATCAAATESEADAFLHDLVCAMTAAGIWNIALTPNYNADHRAHFHLGLTPDEDLVEPAAVRAVDHGPDRH